MCAVLCNIMLKYVHFSAEMLSKFSTEMLSNFCTEMCPISIQSINPCILLLGLAVSTHAHNFHCNFRQKHSSQTSVHNIIHAHKQDQHTHTHNIFFAIPTS